MIDFTEHKVGGPLLLSQQGLLCMGGHDQRAFSATSQSVGWGQSAAAQRQSAGNLHPSDTFPGIKEAQGLGFMGRKWQYSAIGELEMTECSTGLGEKWQNQPQLAILPFKTLKILHNMKVWSFMYKVLHPNDPMGIHFLCCAHGNKCMGTHDAVCDTFVVIV
jgi:hypothetical protein